MKQDEISVCEEPADDEGDDVPHPVVGVEQQLAARLGKVAQTVARMEHLRRFPKLFQFCIFRSVRVSLKPNDPLRNGVIACE